MALIYRSLMRDTESGTHEADASEVHMATRLEKWKEGQTEIVNNLDKPIIKSIQNISNIMSTSNKVTYFNEINHKLRTGNYSFKKEQWKKANVDKIIEDLDIAFQKVPALQNSLTVYRGIPGEYYVTTQPSVYIERGYISTSLQPEVSDKYRTEEKLESHWATKKCCLLELNVQPETKVLYLDAITGKNESEVLIQRDSVMALTRVTESNGVNPKTYYFNVYPPKTRLSDQREATSLPTFWSAKTKYQDVDQHFIIDESNKVFQWNEEKGFFEENDEVEIDVIDEQLEPVAFFMSSTEDLETATRVVMRKDTWDEDRSVLTREFIRFTQRKNSKKWTLEEVSPPKQPWAGMADVRQTSIPPSLLGIVDNKPKAAPVKKKPTPKVVPQVVPLPTASVPDDESSEDISDYLETEEKEAWNADASSAIAPTGPSQPVASSSSSVVNRQGTASENEVADPLALVYIAIENEVQSEEEPWLTYDHWIFVIVNVDHNKEIANSPYPGDIVSAYQWKYDQGQFQQIEDWTTKLKNNIAIVISEKEIKNPEKDRLIDYIEKDDTYSVSIYTKSAIVDFIKVSNNSFLLYKLIDNFNLIFQEQDNKWKITKSLTFQKAKKFLDNKSMKTLPPNLFNPLPDLTRVPDMPKTANRTPKQPENQEAPGKGLAAQARQTESEESDEAASTLAAPLTTAQQKRVVVRSKGPRVRTTNIEFYKQFGMEPQTTKQTTPSPNVKQEQQVAADRQAARKHVTQEQQVAADRQAAQKQLVAAEKKVDMLLNEIKQERAAKKQALEKATATTPATPATPATTTTASTPLMLIHIQLPPPTNKKWIFVVNTKSVGKWTSNAIISAYTYMPNQQRFVKKDNWAEELSAFIMTNDKELDKTEKRFIQQNSKTKIYRVNLKKLNDYIVSFREKENNNLDVLLFTNKKKQLYTKTDQKWSTKETTGQHTKEFTIILDDIPDNFMDPKPDLTVVPWAGMAVLSAVKRSNVPSAAPGAKKVALVTLQQSFRELCKDQGADSITSQVYSELYMVLKRYMRRILDDARLLPLHRGTATITLEDMQQAVFKNVGLLQAPPLPKDRARPLTQNTKPKNINDPNLDAFLESEVKAILKKYDSSKLTFKSALKIIQAEFDFSIESKRDVIKELIKRNLPPPLEGGFILLVR